MIFIDLETVDFTPLLCEGDESLEMSYLRANKFIKMAMKMYLGCELNVYEIEMLNTARDFCISESVKDEIRFK